VQSSKIYSSQAKTQTKLPVLSSLKQKTVYKICIFRQIIFFICPITTHLMDIFTDFYM